MTRTTDNAANFPHKYSGPSRDRGPQFKAADLSNDVLIRTFNRFGFVQLNDRFRNIPKDVVCNKLLVMMISYKLSHTRQLENLKLISYTF